MSENQMHVLKTDPQVFNAVKEKQKLFEIRKNDRNFKECDSLLLLKTKYDGEDMASDKISFPLIYTGSFLNVRIIHILKGPIYGLEEGWVIMSIEHIPTQ